LWLVVAGCPLLGLVVWSLVGRLVGLGLILVVGLAAEWRSVAEWRRVCRFLFSRLSPSEYVVLCLLAGLGGSAQRRLLDVALSERSVDRALARLVEVGLVSRRGRGRYELLIPSRSESSQGH